MLKKIKHIALFTLLGLYLLQLATMFIGDFTNEIQELRRQNQIAKLELVETKYIPLAHWNAFGKKKEIIINNEYYDVVAFEILNDQVKVDAVKDSFDIHLKATLKNIFKSKDLQNSNKKKPSKNLNPTSFFVENISFEAKKSNIQIISKPVVFSQIGEIIKITNTTFRPPCYLI